MMMHLVAEITEGPAHPNLWNPTILGVLVVISAIGLFCGSAYLLLATNLGARLGFLVAFASLTGFMVLLSTLWWTSGNSGIDPPHGRSPSWKVVEIVSDPAQSKIPAVQNIAQHGHARRRECSSATCGPRWTPRSCTAAPIEGVTPPVAAVREVRGVARLPHRLHGLQELHGRRRHQQLVLAHAEVRGRAVLPGRPEPAAGQRARVRPARRTSRTRSSATTSDRCASRWCSSSGSRRSCSSVSRCSALHWYETDERKRKKAALAPVPVSDGERIGGRHVSRAAAHRRRVKTAVPPSSRSRSWCSSSSGRSSTWTTSANAAKTRTSSRPPAWAKCCAPTTDRSSGTRTAAVRSSRRSCSSWPQPSCRGRRSKTADERHDHNLPGRRRSASCSSSSAWHRSRCHWRRGTDRRSR